LGLRSARPGRQKTELSRSGERIVAGDVAELAEERGALVDGGTRELAERVFGSWARQELSAADGQGSEPQQPFVVFGQFAYVVGQALERASVLIQTFGGGSHTGAAEHGRVEEEVMNDGVASWDCHGPLRPFVPWRE
jgi:hypothetical protein